MPPAVCYLGDRYTYIPSCWPLPSNQSFYREIAGYQRGVYVTITYSIAVYCFYTEQPHTCHTILATKC